MKKILLDMDGVIADFYAGFGQYLNEHQGAGLDLESEPAEYSIHQWGHDIPNDTVDAEIPRWVISGGYMNMPIYPGAAEFVNELMSRYDVYIVTARVGDFRIEIIDEVKDIIKSDTKKWLDHHGIPSDKLMFEHKKIDICKELGILVLIEDKLSTVVDASKSDMGAILMNRGWNQKGDAWYGEHLHRNHPNLHVAYHYGDVLDIAGRLLG